MSDVAKAIERERKDWNAMASESPTPGTDPALFPELWALYQAGKLRWAAERADSRCTYFFYFGRRYGWAVTNLARFKVLDWSTKAVIVQGPPGVMEEEDAQSSPGETG